MKRYLLLVLVVLLIPVLYSVTVAAEENISFTVVSEYQSLIPGRAGNLVYWQFKEKNLGADGFEVEIEDRDQKVGCRAELYFNPNRDLVQADCFRWVNGKEICSADRYEAAEPVILSSTIIPGDWLNRPLPFVYKAGKRKFITHEQIGTTRFATYLTVQERRVSFKNAVSAGMIRDDLQASSAISDSLCLVEITVNGATGSKAKVLLQQLWAEGDMFWLYEAKEGRRSWRMLQK